MKYNQLDLADMSDDVLMKYFDGMGKYDTRGKELAFENMTIEEHEYWDERFEENIKILESAQKICNEIGKQHEKSAKKYFVDNITKRKEDYLLAKRLGERMIEKDISNHSEITNEIYIQAVREAIKIHAEKKEKNKKW